MCLSVWKGRVSVPEHVFGPFSLPLWPHCSASISFPFSFLFILYFSFVLYFCVNPVVVSFWLWLIVKYSESSLDQLFIGNSVWRPGWVWAMDPSTQAGMGTLTCSAPFHLPLQVHLPWWLELCFLSMPSEARCQPFPSGFGTDSKVLWPTACQGFPTPRLVWFRLTAVSRLDSLELKCVLLSPFLCLFLFSEERGQFAILLHDASVVFQLWVWSQSGSRSSHVILSLLAWAFWWVPLPSALRLPLARSACGWLQPDFLSLDWEQSHDSQLLSALGNFPGMSSWLVTLLCFLWSPECSDTLLLSSMFMTLSLLAYFSSFCFVIHVLEDSSDFSLKLICDIKFRTHIFNFFPVLYLFVNSILFLDYGHAIFSWIFLRLNLIFCCFIHGHFLKGELSLWNSISVF